MIVTITIEVQSSKWANWYDIRTIALQYRQVTNWTSLKTFSFRFRPRRKENKYTIYLINRYFYNSFEDSAFPDVFRSQGCAKANIR